MKRFVGRTTQAFDFLGYRIRAGARLRDELLNGEIFYTLREALLITEPWHCEYNTLRPYSSLGYCPPAPATVQWPPWPRNGNLLDALT